MAEPDKELEALVEQIDETEIVSVIQRIGEGVEVDTGDTDPDVAISMLAKGFLQLVMDELLIDEFDDEEDEEGEGEDTPA